MDESWTVLGPLGLPGPAVPCVLNLGPSYQI